MVASFPKGTGCGADGLRADHLKTALRCPNAQIAQAALDAVTRLVNVALAGRLPPDSAEFLASAPVVPIAKRDGGIRPIAVGETWRRLTSKCAAKMVVSSMSEHMRPIQLGVGIKNGAEAIIHAAQCLAETKGGEDLLMLKIDFQNAFNLVNREVMMSEVRQHCPQVAAWVEYCYAARPHLFLDKNRCSIRSVQGVQQGDPLGPLLFALTIHPLLLKIAEHT